MKTGLERIVLILVALAAALIMFITAGGKPDMTAPTPEKPAYNAPESVLHYNDDDDCEDDQGNPSSCKADDVIACYNGAAYTDFVKNEVLGSGMTAYLTAALDGGETLIIYRDPADGRFIAMVSGPDKSGAAESCIVAHGAKLNLMTP